MQYDTIATRWDQDAKGIAADLGATTELRTTDQLRAGNIVHTHGLRVLLVETPRYVEGAGIQALTARGRITNPEWLQTPEGRALFGGIIEPDSSDGWTIQGTSSRTFSVEVAA